MQRTIEIADFELRRGAVAIVRWIMVTAAFASLASGIASARPADPKQDLAAVGFLVGRWESGRGAVSDTGGTSTGNSIITREAGGTVLLRRDHTDLFDTTGKPQGGFDQIMMIYPEGGTLHADYSDGTHVIHYRSAVVEAGHSVVFTSDAGAGPVFRLGYTLSAPDTLAISFSMAPPGSTSFRPIATGTLRKAG